MISDPLFAAYLATTAALALTPGATTAVVIRNTLAGGRSAGLAAAGGAALGNVTQAALAGLGVALLLARWPAAFTGLRVAGAIYLAWLGLSSLRRARALEGGLPSLARPVAPGEHHRSVREGLTVNLLNPAISTFYLIVVPSFLPSGAPRGYFAVLAAIHVAMALTCHGLWAVGLGRVRRTFERAGPRRVLEALAGVALLALAAVTLRAVL